MMKHDQQRPQQGDKDEQLKVHFGGIDKGELISLIWRTVHFRICCCSIYSSSAASSALEPLEQIDIQQSVELKTDHDEKPAD